MKKTNLLIALMVFVVALCLTVVACNFTIDTNTDPDDNSSNGDDPNSKNITISFNSNGGSAIASISVTKGEIFTAPNVPTKEGYTFVGWYVDSALTEQWDFSVDSATTSITLYAKWSSNAGKIVAFTNGVINGTDIEVVVGKDTDALSIETAVTLDGNATWKLYYDILGQIEIPTKIATQTNGKLNDGDNIFYIVSSTYDGTQVYTYKLVVHRQYLTSVEFKFMGKTVKTLEILTKSMITDSDVPTVEGYTISDWTYAVGSENENWDFSTQKVQGFTTLNAKYTPNTYTVTLDPNGGTLSSTTEEVTFDSTYSLPVPTKVGHTFKGWYFDGKQYTYASGSSLSPWSNAEDTTLFAKWEINTYKVTANKNISGAGSVSGGGYHEFNSNVTLSANTNVGYTWLGWYDSNGTKVSIGTDETFSFVLGTENVTYTAKWYKTVLEKNISSAGSISQLDRAYKVGDVVTVNATTNTGYTWLGWYEGNTKVSDGTSKSLSFTMADEGKTYTAKWMKCPVALEKNISVAGTVNGVEKTVVGEKTTITATTNSGYTWLGWYDGDTKVSNGTDTTYTFTMTEESKVYVAKWIAYTITTTTNDANGGTYTQYDNKKVTVGEEITLVATTNDGYTWLGWYDGEVKVSDGTSATYTFEMGNSSKTYTAKWAFYTISTSTNDENAGTYTQYSQKKMTAGTEISLLANTNEGYTWIGWFEGETLVSSELEYVFDMPAKNVEYTAKWMCYTLTTNSNNNVAGQYTVYNNTKTPAGSEITLTATTNNEYVWLGWYDGDTKVSDGTSTIYTFKMTMENKTYTAKWSKLALEKNIDVAGSVSGIDKAFSLGDSVTISATTNSGYTWLGWYDGNVKISDGTSPTYTFNATAENKTYLAKWSKVTLAKNISSAGNVYGLNQTFKVGDSATITATTNDGYTWLGWYNGSSLLTEDTSYTFTMTEENVTYTAKWTSYTLTTTTNDSTHLEYTTYNTQKVTKGKQVVLTASVKATSLGYKFMGWYNGDALLTTEFTYIFNMPAQNVTYTAIWGVVDEMSNFEFSSTATTCSISDVKDKSVTEIVIPDYVTRIESFAIINCKNIKTINIPASVTRIEGSAFAGCTALETVTFAENSKLSTISSGAFQRCTSLKTITVPNSVTSIGSGAFNSCTSLESITLPFVGGSKKSATDTYQYPFGYIFGTSSYDGGIETTQYYYADSTSTTTTATYYVPASLKSVKITDGRIIPFSFRGCNNIVDVSIGSAVTEIGKYAFYQCAGLESIIFENNSILSKIEQRAFYQCTNLDTVSFGSNCSISVIEEYAFYGCSSLTSISIPDNLTTIQRDAFDSTGLTTLNISENSKLTTIGSCAFRGTAIKELYIPAGLTTLSDDSFVFACGSFESIVVAEGNTTFHSESNCLIETDTKTLRLGCKNSVIPADGSVEIIGRWAFDCCSELVDIILPDTITDIYTYAFRACTGLQKVYYSGTLENKANIYIVSSGSEYIEGATWYYYSETVPIEEGNYWYYDSNGNVVEW